ncbi:MAG TPA: LUD domain-containing protein [Candidatus Didemnitutus sp.]|nr:LUD domain-containing protein [Candidatus Didemnitutus sp.]
MSTAREQILSRVRSALAPLPQRAAYPEYPADVAAMKQLFAGRENADVFSERIKLVNGLALSAPSALAAWLKERGHLHGYCDPQLWPSLAAHFDGIKVETAFDRSRVDDYAFGITRAAGAIAETGTVIINDTTTASRLGALAPWVHVAVVPREKIFRFIADAAAELDADPNVIWCTGPSKTADVEGILIEGVHGPGAQIALLV